MLSIGPLGPEQDWGIGATALAGVQPGDGRFWTTQLSNGLELSPLPMPPPSLSVETLAATLGANGFFSYYVGGFGDYHGRATLIGTHSEVPEPASLLLFGTGMSALAARRWRNRRREVTDNRSERPQSSQQRWGLRGWYRHAGASRHSRLQTKRVRGNHRSRVSVFSLQSRSSTESRRTIRGTGWPSNAQRAAIPGPFTCC